MGVRALRPITTTKPATGSRLAHTLRILPCLPTPTSSLSQSTLVSPAKQDSPNVLHFPHSSQYQQTPATSRFSLHNSRFQTHSRTPSTFKSRVLSHFAFSWPRPSSVKSTKVLPQLPVEYIIRYYYNFH